MNIKKRIMFKAQVTPFIIMGIVILVLISAASYIAYMAKKSPFDLSGSEVTGPKIAAVFDIYVKGCIEKESDEPLLNMGIRGGTLYPQEPDFLYYNSTKVSYLCRSEGIDPRWSCVNSLLTKSQMEFELSTEMGKRLKKCIHLDEFRRHVSSINAGELSVGTEIAKDDVIFTVHYPVNMTFRGSVVSIYKFTSKIDYPLGRLYSFAEQIVNEEISNGYFDIDSWMAEHGADIVIEKHRPYPDAIYILRKSKYTFQFALQGLPSVGQVIGKKKNYYGCCIVEKDSMCFRNTDPLRCVELDSSYNPNIGCSCTSSYESDSPCTEDDCRNCDAAGKKHGESWCVYDTIPGMGQDYVGSRHYKQSCMNGTVYTEECRDYREELCTQQEEDGMIKAMCRPNRWNTCSQCDTKTCCDDERYRDCHWDSYLSTNEKCIPQVPPGLRFWNNEGAEVCLAGNQRTKCNSISCPQEWLDSAARYCYSQGDCGNYRNMEDVFSSGGFYETDILKNVDDSAYPSPGRNKIPENNAEAYKLNLSFNRESSDVISSGGEQLNSISLFISSLSNFFDDLSRIDPSAYANPYARRNTLEIEDFSICSLWVAPAGDANCSLCSADSVKPCTEYRCRSIGESCQFEMKEGVPSCSRISLLDFSSPVVDIDRSVIPKEYTVERSYLGSYEGYTIIEPIKPHKPFTFSIETDEDTRCTVSLTPRIGDYSLQTVLLGDAVFRKNHNITIRMPPRLVVPEKLFSAMNFTSKSSTLGIFYSIKDIFNSINTRLSSQLEIYGRITGKNFTKQIQPKVERIAGLMAAISSDADLVVRSLLDQFDRGGYYIFFDCIDRAGNRNKNQVFVQFIVDYRYNDNEPPVIITTDPENSGKASPSFETVPLKIYLDEPAECRYDLYDTEYSLMNRSFSCLSAGYQLSPVAGGTYECRADIDVPFAENKIFIRCSDNPGKKESYTLYLFDSNITGIRGIENYNSNISNVTLLDYLGNSGDSISAPAVMLEGLSFGINASEISFNLYLDDKKQCRYSAGDVDFSEMQDSFDECVVSDDLKKGVYMCRAVISPEASLVNIFGNYTLNINITDRSKMIDANPERISIDNNKVLLSFGGVLSGTDSIELNLNNVTVGLSINRSVQCSMADAFEKAEMSCEGNSTTICSRDIMVQNFSKIILSCKQSAESGSGSKEYHYYIKCSDADARARNTNNESYEHNIFKANELVILELAPSGVLGSTKAELSLKVSEDIIQDGVQCGYNDNPYSYLKMEKSGYRDFRAELPEFESDREYTYYIQCTDSYGGKVAKTTKFKVIK